MGGPKVRILAPRDGEPVPSVPPPRHNYIHGLFAAVDQGRGVGFTARSPHHEHRKEGEVQYQSHRRSVVARRARAERRSPRWVDEAGGAELARYDGASRALVVR